MTRTPQVNLMPVAVCLKVSKLKFQVPQLTNSLYLFILHPTEAQMMRCCVKPTVVVALKPLRAFQT